MPRSSLEPLRTSIWFQPTCGDLTASEKREHSPEKRAAPGVPGASVLPANNHCMPTHIPRNGLQLEMPWSTVLARFLLRDSQRLKCPTPGTTIFSAVAITAGSEVTCASAPRCSRAFFTELMLPAP